MHFYTMIDSPLGAILLTSTNSVLTGIWLPEHPQYSHMKRGTYSPDHFFETCTQLNEYFQGARFSFTLPIELNGTTFQECVWKALCTIPYGTTISYATLASDISHTRANRAVGNTNGKNPLAILIPCHRVIRSDGSLGGYAGGLDAKRWLLNHEKKYGMHNFTQLLG